MPRHTIKKTVSCNGIGLHSGERSFLEFRPASEDNGIWFINNGKRISAVPDNVTNTQRGTTLSTIWTVEHVLSAVYGLGIDNIEIYIEGCEPPAMDGSAKVFTELIKSAGIVSQEGDPRDICIAEQIKVESGGSYISIEPMDRLLIEATIDYSPSFVGIVSAKFDEDADDYEKEISHARTFGFLKEVEELKKHGLAKGATFENAIAILENSYSVPLRYADELARHKILDILGDVALVGGRIKGKITSYKAGHKLNIALARRIIHVTS